MDQRDYLDVLDEYGMLIRIDKEVDWNLEAAAISAMLARVGNGNYVVLFENIKGYYPDKGRLVGCMYAPNRRKVWNKIAISMGMAPDVPYAEFMPEFSKRLRRLIKPMEVSAKEAPCKEIIKVGKEVNLLDLPIPFLHETDGGRYLTLHAIANQDPDTGWINSGTYRWMVKGPRRGAGLWVMGQHGPTIYYTKYEQRGNTMPFVIYNGGDPLGFIVATSSVPTGVCEYDALGGLRGEPIRLVRAETNNLLVPADAEVVIEGEIRPGERTDEGPFGEYTGYTHGRNISPLFRVNCITYRKNPIISFVTEGLKWAEDFPATLGMCHGYREYAESVGVKGIKSFLFNMDTCTMMSFGFDPEKANDPMRLGRLIMGHKAMINVNTLGLHDPDVDVIDSRDTLEDFGLACDPRVMGEFTTDDDVYLTPLTFISDAENRSKGTDGAKNTWDCTSKFKRWKKPPRASFDKAYPAEIRKRVEDSWPELGFDEPFDDKIP
ncbi:MAG: UbiD family decarboxylase [Thermodesulfobacteriota bacterium]|nr:UbiD family decarboxylase [Thermodesulfobacteriota bacterium]